jgi:manganese transport protein
MLGLEYTKTRFRIFALFPVVGILGVVTKLPFWFPVAASAICFAMLPIAYLLFYVLNNKESYLGEGMMKWPRREFFNIILVIALTVSVVGALIKIKTGAIDKVAEYIAGAAAAEPVLIETPSGAPREQPAGLQGEKAAEPSEAAAEPAGSPAAGGEKQ